MISDGAATSHLSAFLSHQEITCLWPKLQQVSVETNIATIEWYIPPDLKWFDGHFPNQPVLPGIVQIHWAALLGAELCSKHAELSMMTRLKFNTMVVPETTLTLHLKVDQNQSKLTFRYAQLDCEYSSGTLFLGP